MIALGKLSAKISGKPLLLPGRHWINLAGLVAVIWLCTRFVGSTTVPGGMLPLLLMTAIALAFGVPPMLIGIPGDATYANYQEANRAFWRLTVLPLVQRTAASFAAWLAGDGAGLRLVPALDQVSGLVAERSELWTRVAAAGFLTDEEKRRAVGY